MAEQNSTELCLTPQEVGKRLGISADVVRTRFRKVPGVIIYGDGRRKTIRIPQSVLEAWLAQHQVKEGR